MKRKVVVRNVTLATLTAGIGAVGLKPASAGESSASLCRSTFGDSGPAGRSVVGEGPPGDPMTVTVGWDPGDWPEGLREVVTCVSVGGQVVPGMTRLTVDPPNAGNIAVDLTLPLGAPGSLVCQQSILIGMGSTEGRRRSTEAACFKLRAPEVPAIPGTIGGVTSPPARSGDEPVRIPNTHPAYPPAATTPVRIPSPNPATPPARTAVAAPEPAPARVRAPKAAPAAPAPKVAARPATRSRPAPAPAVAAASAPAAKADRAANELARSGSPATVATAGAPAADSAGTARSGLPRTGLADRIPLAAAGGLMALGGAAIIMGEPRRRNRRTA